MLFGITFGQHASSTHLLLTTSVNFNWLLNLRKSVSTKTVRFHNNFNNTLLTVFLLLLRSGGFSLMSVNKSWYSTEEKVLKSLFYCE